MPCRVFAPDFSTLEFLLGLTCEGFAQGGTILSGIEPSGGFAMTFVTGIAVCLVLVSSAFGQADSTTLRSKYGEPLKYRKRLNSETFRVRDKIKMVVNYAPSGQVCRVEVPPGRSIIGQSPPDSATKQQVDEVFQEVVPPATRGKDIRGGRIDMGGLSLLRIEYEHVTITELLQAETPTSFTVPFKQDGCETPETIR
jgi:hypothetical protein